MKNKLQQYFPMIRTEGEVLKELRKISGYGKHFADGKKNIRKNTLTSVQVSKE